MELEDHHNADDQELAPTHSSPPGGGVMDIQPPKPGQPGGAPAVPGVTAPLHSDTPAPFSAPASTHSTHHDFSGGSSGGAFHVPAAEELSHSEAHHDPHHELLAAHASHRRSPKVVIVLAVVIGAALIGLAVFAYMQTRDNTHPAGDNGTHQEEAQTEAQASPADVDNTTKAVDDALSSVDDAQDIPESELTDQTLGL